MSSSPKVWHIRDAKKPADGLYIGRAGKGQTGKWGNPFPIDRPLTKVDAQKIAERLPMLAELEYADAGARADTRAITGALCGLPYMGYHERLS